MRLDEPIAAFAMTALMLGLRYQDLSKRAFGIDVGALLVVVQDADLIAIARKILYDPR